MNPMARLSTQMIIALIGLPIGNVAAVAEDYRVQYGNNAYYGNIYGNNGAYEDNRDNPDSGVQGDGQRHRQRHPMTGNECSSDTVSGSSCGGNP